MKFKNTKICIVGIQGSGKTELAKFIASRFKNSLWFLVNLDDIVGMPSNVETIMAEEKTIQELNRLCKVVIELAKQDKINCFVIDEADMFLNRFKPLPKYLNDLVINHRHYGLALIFITRRPQDIHAKIVESSHHLFIFAMPNSDNIERKMKAIDKDLLMEMERLSVEEHNFIYKGIHKKPIVMPPLNINLDDTKHNEIIKMNSYIENHSKKESLE